MNKDLAANPLSLKGSWDVIAEGYAEVMAPFLSAFSIAALKEISLRADMRVLDLACGPGTTSMHLAADVNEVIAQDFSPEMIAQLEKAITNSRLKNIKPVVGDGHSIDSPNASFDLVISMFGLMFFPEKKKAFSEIARVLKPGGFLVVGSWAPIETSTMMTAVLNALASSQKKATAQRQPGMLDKREQYDEFLSGTSLVIDKFVEFEGTMNALNARAFWDDMEKGTAPIVMMKRSMPAKEWRKTRDAAISYLEQKYEFPRRLGSVANIAVLRKK